MWNDESSWKVSGKSQNFIKLLPSAPPEMKILSVQVKAS